MAFLRRIMQKTRRFSGLLLLAFFAAGLCFSAGSLLRRSLALRREAAAFRKLAAELRPASAQSETGPSTAPARNAETPFDRLSAQNPDCWGWLTVEGTGIDYPVMYTPLEPEYYLRRDFSGKPSLSGTPFADGTVPPGGANTVIYGHNMENGAMFAPLLSYRSQQFCEEHPFFTLQTRQGTFRCRVIAAFATEILPLQSDAFCYYDYVDLASEADFTAYVEGCRALTAYPIAATASPGDRLVTLSTCSYHTANGRFVVVAKCVEKTGPAPPA